MHHAAFERRGTVRCGALRLALSIGARAGVGFNASLRPRGCHRLPQRIVAQQILLGRARPELAYAPVLPRVERAPELLDHPPTIADAATRAEAEALGAHMAVVTFDKHPAMVVRPDSAPKLLTTLDHKLELLEELGVEYTYVVSFDAERAQESAGDFIRDVLVDCLKAKVVVVGSDFHFGRGREGNIDVLGRLGEQHGFEAVGVFRAC